MPSVYIWLPAAVIALLMLLTPGLPASADAGSRRRRAGYPVDASHPGHTAAHRVADGAGDAWVRRPRRFACVADAAHGSAVQGPLWDAHGAPAGHPQLRVRATGDRRARPQGHGAGLAGATGRRPPAVHIRSARRGIYPHPALVSLRDAAGEGCTLPRRSCDGGGCPQPGQERRGRVFPT